MSTGRPRIALTLAGDASSPTAFSGTTSSVVDALRETGMPVAAIGAELPAAAQRALVNVLVLGLLERGRLRESRERGVGVRIAVRSHKPKVHASREMALIRSAVVALRLRRTPGLERVIQWGSEYRLPAGTDYVTLDDATIPQLRRSYPYPWMGAVSDVTLRHMMTRQREILRGARACCVLNRWAANGIREDYAVPEARIHVVGAGASHTLTPTVRSWDRPRFLFVGKDFDRKNGPRVLSAFREVRRRHSSATLDVVGGHPRLDEEGVSGHGVLSLGSDTQARQLEALFATATCLVLPSLLEPTGNVHAEALAAGIGSIGTSRGGPDLIIGNSGLIVDPFDDAAILEAMFQFCDPERMREYGAKAQRRAPMFTWRAVAERLVRALQLPGFDCSSFADFL